VYIRAGEGEREEEEKGGKKSWADRTGREKKKEEEKRGWSGHPLGHWSGWATTKPAGLVVAKPPQWPKGVAGPPPVKEKKKKKKT
jgi:hypothetical protein